MQQHDDPRALARAAIHARERIVDTRTAYVISRGRHIGKPAPQPQTVKAEAQR